MARFYAQLCTLLFVALAVGGVFLGDASHVVNGQANGNLGSIQLHLTYVRDALDVVLVAALIWIGFLAPRHAGRWAMGAVGAFLLILGIAGFVVGDTDAGGRAIAGLHFPTAMNILDTVVGVLGLLAALGTVEDELPASIIRG
ncbi:MAG: hypothetical protein ACR2GX_06900 [Candidatus Dormibacteria bacterium]